ncbi:MAG: hypothetical protein GX483_03200 [Actinomycetaceae bacterium]|nr:hypothetical protein [Actinomycetaceae bacterium]
MSANWDYAMLTLDASQYGGPEQFRKALDRAGQRKGAIKTIVAVALVAVVYSAYRSRFVQTQIAKARYWLSSRFQKPEWLSKQQVHLLDSAGNEKEETDDE